MLDAKGTIAPETDAHLPPEHPPVRTGRIGVLLANLGTPDGTDYGSMRRYLNEFLSDRRVIDYSPWIWQPLLQTVILGKRPFTSGAAYRSIWNEEAHGTGGRIPATVELIHLSGWAPSPDQPKPLRPGSASMRLADALNVPERPLPRE